MDWVFAGAVDGSANVSLEAVGGLGPYADRAALQSAIAAYHATRDSLGQARKIVVLVANGPSGSGIGNANFSAANANAVAQGAQSITALLNLGFDGIDWDLEDATLWDQPTVDAIDTQLRAAFPHVIVMQVPRPYELHMGASPLTKRQPWLQQMDYTAIQYYFQSGGGPFDCSNIQALESGTDGNAEGIQQLADDAVGGTPSADQGPTVSSSRLILVNSPDGSGQAGCSPADYVAAFHALRTTMSPHYPALRGAMVWQWDVDRQNGWTFAKAFGAELGLH